MIDNTIRYNGHDSSEYGLYWQASDFELNSPSISGDTYDIAGIDGTIVELNGSYKSFKQPFTFVAEHKQTPPVELKKRMTTWLNAGIQKGKAYSELRFGKTLDYIYYAIPDLDNYLTFPAYNSQYSTITINFTVFPYKYLARRGQTDKESVTLQNPENYDAHPLIHVEGQGRIDLFVNDVPYHLLDVDDEIYIDCEKYLVYKDKTETGRRDDKVVFPDHQFPVLPANEKSVIRIAVAPKPVDTGSESQSTSTTSESNSQSASVSSSNSNSATTSTAIATAPTTPTEQEDKDIIKSITVTPRWRTLC